MRLHCPDKMSLQTYGEKPKRFQIEENGEYYCMGSEVGNYLGFFRGTLYKRYPGMFRRSVTNDERKKLVKLGLNQYVPTSIVCLVRAREVEDIIAGNDNKYKIPSVRSNDPPASRKGKSKQPIPWASTLPNSSRSDVAPQATSIDLNRVHNNIAKTFPSCFDDTGRSTNLGIGLQQEILIPMGLDNGRDGQELKDHFTWRNNAKQDSRKDYAAIETAVENTPIADNLAQYEPAYNYDCRICLKNSDKFWEIFQTQNLPQKIMEVAYVQVQYGDGLPSVICFACRQLLDMFYDFKCLVEKSDAILRNALLSRMEISQDTMTESLSDPIHNDFQIQCESQLRSLRNFNHMLSNDYDHKQNSVAYQIHEECINMHKNDSDNQRYVEKDEDSSEAEIIALSEDSKILRENQRKPIADKLINPESQSMESESKQIKQEEVFLSEEDDISEGRDNHQSDETIFHSDLKIKLNKNLFAVEEEKIDDVPCSRLEITNCETPIGDITVETEIKVDKLEKDIDSDERIVERDCNFKYEVCRTHFTHEKSFHPEYEECQTSNNRSKQFKNREESRDQNDLFDYQISETDEDDLPMEDLQYSRCGECFPIKGNLKRNILIHSSPGFNCSTSGMEFSRLDHFKVHEQSKHKDGMCPKAFAQSQPLANHMVRYKRINEPQKRFFCDVCSKCFAQNGSLLAHKRTHTGVYGVQLNIS